MNEFSFKVKAYYTEIKKKLSDNRDNRGKRHNLAFTIVLFMYSILRNSDRLNYLKIHREMKREFRYIKRKLALDDVNKCISYSQFKRVLQMIDYEEFNSINNDFFGKQVVKENRSWKSVDGKELRGTIDKLSGQKRSENLVQQITHQDKESVVMGFYNGSKESEKTVVKTHFDKEEKLNNEAFTFDALHTNTSLLETINQKEGVYLAQVKENQKHLLEDCKHLHQNIISQHKYSTTEKGHGRLEIRDGYLYPMNIESLDDRWKNTNIQTLVAIERDRTVLKNGQHSNETAYFIANLKLDHTTGNELFNACRNHWRVEADNYVRDVNFGEDKIHCLLEKIPRIMAIALGTVLNILRRKNKTNNLRELRENIAKNRRLANACFYI